MQAEHFLHFHKSVLLGMRFSHHLTTDPHQSCQGLGGGNWRGTHSPRQHQTQLAKVSAVSLLILSITTSYSCYAVRVPEASAGCGLTTGNKRLKLFFPALSWQPGAQQAMQQPCPCGTTTHHPPMCQHLHSPGGSWPSQNVLNTSSGISSSVLLSLKPLSTWS